MKKNVYIPYIAMGCFVAYAFLCKSYSSTKKTKDGFKQKMVKANQGEKVTKKPLSPPKTDGVQFQASDGFYL